MSAFANEENIPTANPHPPLVPTFANQDNVAVMANENEREVTSLPNVDDSKEAWSFVIAAFVVETLLWGPLFSIAVFLKYYALSSTFESASETQISLIGTLSLLFGYSSGLPLLYFYNRDPRLMKPSMWFGLGTCVLALLAASFVRDIRLLILFQGVGPGLAAALCAFPIIRWLPEWFDKRRGIASGVIFSGGGVGGVFMPFLYQIFLDRLGYQWSLRIVALSTGVVASIAICFVKPRIPISSTAPINRMPMPSLSQTFLKTGFFSTFLCTLLQAFGFFNVNLFLPRFSDTLSSTSGAGLLSAFNVCCIIAQILWGHITDRIRPTSAMGISSSIGCVLVLTLWGFSGNLGIKILAPFAILFGISTGGFSSMWSQNAYEISGPDKEKQTLAFSGFSVARGLGAILGPTIGSALYRLPSDINNNRWGSAGSPGLVGLVAASLAASVLTIIFFRLIKRVSDLLSKKKRGNMLNSTRITSDRVELDNIASS